MKATIKFLFAIADVIIALSLLSGVVILIRVFIATLNTAFGPETSVATGDYSGLVIWGLFLLNVVLILIALLGYVLLLRKQVFGLIPVALVGVLGFFSPYRDIGIYAVFIVFQMLFLGLPWLLTYVDLRTRGELGR